MCCREKVCQTELSFIIQKCCTFLNNVNTLICLQLCYFFAALSATIVQCIIQPVMQVNRCESIVRLQISHAYIYFSSLVENLHSKLFFQVHKMQANKIQTYVRVSVTDSQYVLRFKKKTLIKTLIIIVMCYDIKGQQRNSNGIKLPLN